MKLIAKMLVAANAVSALKMDEGQNLVEHGQDEDDKQVVSEAKDLDSALELQGAEEKADVDIIVQTKTFQIPKTST